MPYKFHPANAGLSLIEALVAVGLILSLLVVFGASISSLSASEELRNRTIAYQVAQNILDSARAYPLAELPLQTDGAPLALPIASGTWEVTDVAGDQVLQETDAAHARQPVPTTVLADSTLQANVRLDSSTASGSGALFYLRYWNDLTHYVVRLAENDLVIERVLNGSSTTLHDSPAGTPTVQLDTWYEILIDITGDTLRVDLDQTTVASVTDNSIVRGIVVLGADAQAAPQFDDIFVHDNLVTLGTFESVTPGTFPATWRTINPFTLPGGNAILSIAEYDSSSSIYQLGTEVSWVAGGGEPRVVSLDTLISDNGIQQ